MKTMERTCLTEQIDWTNNNKKTERKENGLCIVSICIFRWKVNNAAIL